MKNKCLKVTTLNHKASGATPPIWCSHKLLVHKTNCQLGIFRLQRRRACLTTEVMRILSQEMASGGKPSITSRRTLTGRVDKSSAKAGRWRLNSWRRTITICRRRYVTSEAVANFNWRSTAGVLAQEHKIAAQEGAP